MIHSAIMDGLQDNDAFKNNHGDDLNESWATLMKDLKFWENDNEDLVMYLRRRWVLGSSEWMSGMNDSKCNDKVMLDYTDADWIYIWSTMIEDKAWAVPDLKDNSGNILKHNYAPELFIKFIAHDLRSHIIIFDLLLDIIQFCSGNHLKSNNVVFESPLILYYTGSHYQAVFQRNHEFFIEFARQLEADQSPNVGCEDAKFQSKADGHSQEASTSNEKKGDTFEKSKDVPLKSARRKSKDDLLISKKQETDQNQHGSLEDITFSRKSDKSSSEIRPSINKKVINVDKLEDPPFQLAGKKSKYDLRNKCEQIKRNKSTNEKEVTKESLLLSNRFDCFLPITEDFEKEEYFEMGEQSKKMQSV